MNKSFILFCATIGGIAGAYIPALWGDTDMFSGWSILLSTLGGIAGIWLGVIISKRIG
jgi:hypothetical protein